MFVFDRALRSMEPRKTLQRTLLDLNFEYNARIVFGSGAFFRGNFGLKFLQCKIIDFRFSMYSSTMSERSDGVYCDMVEILLSSTKQNAIEMTAAT